MTEFQHQRKVWLEVRIEVPIIAHEPLSAFLFDMDCTGIVTETSPKEGLIAYFPPGTHRKGIHGTFVSFVRSLTRILPCPVNPHITYRQVADEDWGSTWRRFYQPDRVTPRLMIYPSWETVPRSLSGHVIRIDPGPAFGTGLHATTRMCLEALERIIRTDGPWSLLDVGTGTGILAMYGARLGASPILAVDNDPEALSWAGHNIELNRLSDRIRLSSGPVGRLKGGFDVLTANLILHEIEALLKDLVRLTAPGGSLILSGLLGEQVPRIVSSLSRRGLRPRQTLMREEWAAVIAGRQ